MGNHEVWGDPKIEGTLDAVPYLKNFGVTPERLIYKFDFRDMRFIFLRSGKYDYRSPSLWDAGIKKAFVTFHYPVFCRAGLGPIPEPDNPHKTIAAYAKDLELVVFNGHVHTTELYDVDGVKYLVLGGGGSQGQHRKPDQVREAGNQNTARSACSPAAQTCGDDNGRIEYGLFAAAVGKRAAL